MAAISERRAHPSRRLLAVVPIVEAAVYFCCLEALQNVQKYARAESASVRLTQGPDGDSRFEVRDDGAGFDPTMTPRGSGLQNIEDRLNALGGQVVVASSVGAGTSIGGRLPAVAGTRG